MKNTIILAVALALLATAGIWLFRPKATEHRIPDLLERKGALSLSGSWHNTRRAIEGLKAKIRLNPDDQASRLLLAYAYMQEARVTGEHPYYYPAALDLTEQVLGSTDRNDPLYSKAIIAKASVQLSQHRFAEALETGRRALEMGSQDKDLYSVLCDANVELGNYPEAILMADKAVAIRPELGTYSRISYLREIHGNLDGAIAAMQLAVDAGYPGLEQTGWVRCQLGKLYERKGDTANAHVQYEMALLSDPHYGFALAGLAGLAEKAGDRKKALALYEKALNIIPEFSFQQEIAALYLKQGNQAKGRQAAEETIAMLEEDKASGHVVDLELANAYLLLTGDADKALDYATDEYDRRPDNIDVNRTLALIHLKLGDRDKALRHARSALRTGKQDQELAALVKALPVASL